MEAFAVEAVEKELATFGFGEVFGDAEPDEFAGGVVHAAGDGHAFGS